MKKYLNEKVEFPYSNTAYDMNVLKLNRLIFRFDNPMVSKTAFGSPTKSGLLISSSTIMEPFGIRGRKCSIATFVGL